MIIDSYNGCNFNSNFFESIKVHKVQLHPYRELKQVQEMRQLKNRFVVARNIILSIYKVSRPLIYNKNQKEVFFENEDRYKYFFDQFG